MTLWSRCRYARRSRGSRLAHGWTSRTDRPISPTKVNFVVCRSWDQALAITRSSWPTGAVNGASVLLKPLNGLRQRPKAGAQGRADRRNSRVRDPSSPALRLSPSGTPALTFQTAMPSVGRDPTLRSGDAIRAPRRAWPAFMAAGSVETVLQASRSPASRHTLRRFVITAQPASGRRRGRASSRRALQPTASSRGTTRSTTSVAKTTGFRSGMTCNSLMPSLAYRCASARNWSMLSSTEGPTYRAVLVMLS
jgi:hypothetical protein